MIQNPLQTILSPRSIAVAGASNTPAKMGTILYLNLIHGGFSREVFVVHPTQEKIFGKTAYKAAEKLPYAPDVALLVVPAHHVTDLLEDFGKIGTRYVIVVSAGFKETGNSGQDLESKMIETAKRYGMRILGPNCLGVINTRLSLNTTAIPLQDKPGFLSIASQSGTYVTQTLSYLKKKGVRLAKAISLGNEADIDICDCLEYFAYDQDTECIGLYIESIKQADRFLQVARDLTRKKPVIAQYVGGTSAGARAGASHTGAMAGPDFLYEGLFHQAGIIRVDTIEDVFVIGNTLSLSFFPRNRRIGILTNSGGPGTAMATTLDSLGLKVPEFSDGLKKQIKAFLPDHAGSRNPVDLTFHTGMDLIGDKLPEILLKSDEIDGLLIHGIMDTGFADLLYPIFKNALNVSVDDFNAYFMADLTRLTQLPRKYKKPVLISTFMGDKDHCLRTFHDCGIPAFDSPEKAAHAMWALFKSGQIQKQPTDIFSEEPFPIPDKAAEIMKSASFSTMNEYKAKLILDSYGIPICREYLADSEQKAISAACKIGFPVVVKGCLPGIFHKTEQNLVHKDCRNEDDVRKACKKIYENQIKASFLVSEMLPSQREFMAGMSRFKGFPPCILFGIGGIFAEVLKDFSVRLAPFGKNEALRLITTVKSYPLLSAFRGMPSVDLNAVADILIRLGHIASHFPQIKEIDLNPILFIGDQPKVADALFVME
ncbi:MAG: acetate--CoA ligase family protein [Desulfobacterales bacterium]